jgi:hypothetical protein
VRLVVVALMAFCCAGVVLMLVLVLMLVCELWLVQRQGRVVWATCVCGVRQADGRA